MADFSRRDQAQGKREGGQGFGIGGASSKTLIRSKSSQSGPQFVFTTVEMYFLSLDYMHEIFFNHVLMPTFP